MIVVETIQELQAERNCWVDEGVAFVPTMGALHEGHLSLFEKAKAMAPRLVVSIYVNPLQFGPNEDFERYPRTREEDLAVCREYGADVVFYPNVVELHPAGYDNLAHVVPPDSLINRLCGKARPGHFTGVATIVLKLFNIVRPDYAIFGEKDAQQLAVIQQMVRDLNVPIHVIPAPTVREDNGLAKSSRNLYLKTDALKQQSLALVKILDTVQRLYKEDGIVDVQTNFQQALAEVLGAMQTSDFELEYLEAVEEDSFDPVTELSETSRVLIAARVGKTRLIDNALVSEAIFSPSGQVIQCWHSVGAI